MKSLITETLQKSDNTAGRALLRQLNTDEMMSARTAMGLDWPKDRDALTKASPKEYANIFRSLYVSTYLRRTFSNSILSILADTPHQNQLPAGLPPEVKISHKFGVTPYGQSSHDCGIVYLEKKDYLICVMSENATSSEADRIIADISKITYEFMTP